MRLLNAQKKRGGGRERVSESGFTLIEMLAVMTILGVLFSTLGSSLVVSLKSYAGQSAIEKKEYEGQRACMDLGYYLKNAKAVSFQDDAVLSGLFGAAASDAGTTLALQQGDGSVVSFIFSADATKTAALGSIFCAVGSLSIQIGGLTYTYCNDVYIPCGSGSARPFFLGDNGMVVYFFGIPQGDAVFGVNNSNDGSTVMRPALSMLGGCGYPGY